MPLIWGYYHKWIKWADTFWRLALKSGFHSQMEQFQNALLVPWHTNKVCSTQVLVARSGKHHSTFNECVLVQPPPHYQQLLAGWNQQLYSTITKWKDVGFEITNLEESQELPSWPYWNQERMSTEQMSWLGCAGLDPLLSWLHFFSNKLFWKAGG